jgi:pyridoxal phosphate enzyme (YggS family)
MTVADNLAAVRERIATAARAAGREPAEITLVAVTKTVPAAIVAEALDAGACDVGENRAQELLGKAPELATHRPPPRWHFIGRLQRNKVHALAPYVARWQSVDRAELAAEIARHAPGAAVLVQVNVAGEAQKGGCAPDAAPGLVARCREFGLAVDGLMTVPPLAGDPGPFFAQLRRMTDDLGLSICSMGMSGDFERAVAAGATMVRVGSAVFGERPPNPAVRR